MKKKLLFITPLFPGNKDEDTIVPFIYQFCNYLDTNFDDLEIDIITLRYPIKKKEYNINSIKVYAIGGGFKTKWNSVLVIYKGLIKGLQLFRQNNYDGILSFWYSDTALIGNILKLIFKVKHFTWMQGQDVKSSNKILKLFRAHPKNLIALSKRQNKILFDSYRISAEQIANIAIDPKNFPSLNTLDRTIDIIGVGNLGPIKNYNLFIDVVNQLKTSFPIINTVICGDGDQRLELEEKIKKLDLKKNIRILGYITNKEVRELMNNSRFFLHTSVFEGGPLVIHEALYSGCKVVSTIPILADIKNFFFEKSREEIVKRLKFLLYNHSNKDYERIRHFKIEDTADVIYSCFFDSK